MGDGPTTPETKLPQLEPPEVPMHKSGKARGHPKSVKARFFSIAKEYHETGRPTREELKTDADGYTRAERELLEDKK